MKRVLILAMLALALGGCSVKRVAVNTVGDAISGGGNVWLSDGDPELIREALPFALKTNESLLDVSPDHVGLLESTARGFSAYAFLLKQDADRLEDSDVARSRHLRGRVKALFLRGRDYALRGLETRHPGFREALSRDRPAALAMATIDDVALLYWAGAAWAGAISVGGDDAGLIAALPTAGALVGRVLDLDPAYDDGAAQEFFIAYEAGRPGGSIEDARRYYVEALRLSAGSRASVFVALAESVDVPEQDVKEFRVMLKTALAVDPEANPDIRLLNVIARERAEWLETRTPDLFLVAE